MNGPGAVEPDIATTWPDLRRSIFDKPAVALRLLRNLGSDPTTSAAHRVDAITLVAETQLRLGDHEAAATAADAAVRGADRLHQVDSTRLLPAIAVLADVTVYTGQPESLKACHSFWGTVAGDAAARDREYVAAALTAVAIHRDDPAQGRTLLQDLIAAQPVAATAIKAMLSAGLTAMHDTAPQPTDEPPSPVPGGALHRTLSDPPELYLVHRIHAVRRGVPAAEGRAQ